MMQPMMLCPWKKNDDIGFYRRYVESDLDLENIYPNKSDAICLFANYNHLYFDDELFKFLGIDRIFQLNQIKIHTTSISDRLNVLKKVDKILLECKVILLSEEQFKLFKTFQ